MKKLFRFPLLSVIYAMVLLNLLLPTTTRSQNQPISLVERAANYTLFDGHYLDVDLKFPSEEKGDFGIDYQFNLEKHLLSNADKKVNLNIKSDGFVMANGSENSLNSIITEANLELLPLFKAKGGEVVQKGAEGISEELTLLKVCFTREEYDDFIEKYPYVEKLVEGIKEEENNTVCLFTTELIAAEQDSNEEEIKKFRDKWGDAYDEIIKHLPEGGPAQVIELTRKQAKIVHSPLWINANIHFKHEATQDFDDYDLAWGTSVIFSTSYLHAPLDYLFGLLRFKKNNNPRQLDISVGYDYVTTLNQTANKLIREDESNANRLNAKAEWETGIFANDRIIFAYNMHYEFDAPEMVKDADKDLNSFFMIKLDHLIYEAEEAKVQFAIKYTDGELPPNFKRGSVIGGGISFEF
jgi:hypothetical protein